MVKTVKLVSVLTSELNYIFFYLHVKLKIMLTVCFKNVDSLLGVGSMRTMIFVLTECFSLVEITHRRSFFSHHFHYFIIHSIHTIIPPREFTSPGCTHILSNEIFTIKTRKCNRLKYFGAVWLLNMDIDAYFEVITRDN